MRSEEWRSGRHAATFEKIISALKGFFVWKMAAFFNDELKIGIRNAERCTIIPPSSHLTLNFALLIQE